MMGRLKGDQGQFFYSFCLDDVVPDDHRVREIAAVLDLSWVHTELAPYYSPVGRPSIDPVLMIRMLIVGHVFAIRPERFLCREVRVNLAYRWFCGLSLEDSSNWAPRGPRNRRRPSCRIRLRCANNFLRTQPAGGLSLRERRQRIE
jgi:transposase-like protein DUF772